MTGLPGVVYDTDGCPVGVDWRVVFADLLEPPYQGTDPKHPEYVERILDIADAHRAEVDA